MLELVWQIRVASECAEIVVRQRRSGVRSGSLSDRLERLHTPL